MRLRELAIGAALLIALTLAGCGKGDKSAPTASINSGEKQNARITPTSTRATVTGNRPRTAKTQRFSLPVVVIETTMGDIKVRLRDDKAPVTVYNFLENYVDRAFYEQTIFHHVERGVMIAAGGYTPELQAKPTRAWIRNESNNGLSNVRGTIAMARHPDYPHSATSQFFINVADNSSFDFHPPQEGELTDDAYGYCVFGEIIEGLDVAAQISDAQVRSDEVFPSLPVEPVVIKSIHRVSIDANDVN